MADRAGWPMFSGARVRMGKVRSVTELSKLRSAEVAYLVALLMFNRAVPWEGGSGSRVFKGSVRRAIKSLWEYEDETGMTTLAHRVSNYLNINGFRSARMPMQDGGEFTVWYVPETLNWTEERKPRSKPERDAAEEARKAPPPGPVHTLYQCIQPDCEAEPFKTEDARREHVLAEHTTQGVVYTNLLHDTLEVFRQHEGLAPREYAPMLGTTPAAVAGRAAVLYRLGFIRREGRKQAARYYVTDAGRTVTRERALSPQHQRVLEAVRTMPGMLYAEYAELAELDRQDVSDSMHQLRRLGLAHSSRAGSTARAWPGADEVMAENDVFQQSEEAEERYGIFQMQPEEEPKVYHRHPRELPVPPGLPQLGAEPKPEENGVRHVTMMLISDQYVLWRDKLYRLQPVE